MIINIISHNLLAQEIPIIPRPTWVKEVKIPLSIIDSLSHPESSFSNTLLYHEVQINVDTEETFSKKSVLVSDERHKNLIDVKLNYSTKDNDCKIVAVSIISDSTEMNVTNTLNWNEQETKEYVFNKLWESNKEMTIFIDQIKQGDIYTLSLLKKSLRQDVRINDGILLFCRDSVYVYMRIISKEPLNFKTFNGFPTIVEIKNDSHFEYIAKGIAVTPYKNSVPYDFIKIPFASLSRFSDFEQIGYYFKEKLEIDEG